MAAAAARLLKSSRPELQEPREPRETPAGRAYLIGFGNGTGGTSMRSRGQFAVDSMGSTRWPIGASAQRRQGWDAELITSDERYLW